MSATRHVLAIYERPADAAAALEELRERGFPSVEAFSPVPDERILRAAPRRSGAGWFTLVGLPAGFALGIVLAVAGTIGVEAAVVVRPPATPFPYLVVAVVLAVLLGALGAVVGGLASAGLPRRGEPPLWNARLGEDRFGVAASCSPEALELLVQILAEHGAEDVLRA
ncbi:MAG: DUF3341 domain-containing protein [Deltaproteobacteria bacterium]|nr:DUF3341 domain-containing protein [Deltaproteobacteria bacterium]